jgi:fructose-bisphosphate aldolase, class II
MTLGNQNHPQNVTFSSTANAVLEAARYLFRLLIWYYCYLIGIKRDIKSPIIIQVSQGGSAYYYAGKGLANDKQQASVSGAIAAARLVSKEYGVYGAPV